jgi:tetratricopeptide (TPR) repeat protein
MNLGCLDNSWLRLFRRAMASQPEPSARHVAEDDELLACWRDALLSGDERSQLLEHLMHCPRCRRLVAGALLHEPPTLDEDAEFAPTVERAAARPRSGRAAATRQRIGAAAIALGLLVALLIVVRLPRGEGDAPLSAAHGLLREQKPHEALAELERLAAGELPPEQRREYDQLYEQAAYESGRQSLASSEFPAAAEAYRLAAKHGIESARLLNLSLQAERRIPEESALAFAGTLADYGVRLGGYAATKSLPVQDEAALRQEKMLGDSVHTFAGDAVLRLNYGQYLLAQSRPEEAAAEFQAVLADQPASAEATLGLGLAEFQLGRHEAALEHFADVAARRPSDAAAELNMAICLARLGRTQEARLHYRQALEGTKNPERRRQIEAVLAQTED